MWTFGFYFTPYRSYWGKYQRYRIEGHRADGRTDRWTDGRTDVRTKGGRIEGRTQVGEISVLGYTVGHIDKRDETGGGPSYRYYSSLLGGGGGVQGAYNYPKYPQLSNFSTSIYILNCLLSCSLVRV